MCYHCFRICVCLDFSNKILILLQKSQRCLPIESPRNPATIISHVRTPGARGKETEARKEKLYEDLRNFLIYLALYRFTTNLLLLLIIPSYICNNVSK